MKLLEEVKKIVKKHNPKPIKLPENYSDVYDYLRNNPDKENDFKSEIDDYVLMSKYRKHVPRGWYGFDIGTPIIPEWMLIIDEVTKLCIDNDPNFEIHQVKLKYGRICYYVSSSIIEDYDEIDEYIEDISYDKALVYP